MMEHYEAVDRGAARIEERAAIHAVDVEHIRELTENVREARQEIADLQMVLKEVSLTVRPYEDTVLPGKITMEADGETTLWEITDSLGETDPLYYDRFAPVIQRAEEAPCVDMAAYRRAKEAKP